MERKIMKLLGIVMDGIKKERSYLNLSILKGWDMYFFNASDVPYGQK